MTDITITRSAPYKHIVPGTYIAATNESESFEITELNIDGYIVGVEIEGTIYDPCKRCTVGGHYSFNGQDSICYGCHGYSHGKVTDEADIVRRYVARQKAEARRIKAAEKAAKEQADALAAWVAENAEIAEALKAHVIPTDDEGYTDFSFKPRDKFLSSLADQASYKALSPKQTEAARTALARLAEQDKARAEKRGFDIALGHWGEVGKRAEVTVTVEKIIVIEGDYGTSFLCIMKSAEGHALKSFSTGAFVDTAIEAEKTGDAVKVKATVKKHDTYEGAPQTIVTRVAVVA